MTTEYGIRVGPNGSVFPCRDRETAERTIAAGGEFSEASPDLTLILVTRTVTDWSGAELPDDSPRCRWCGDEIGIIHYSDGDRWQPTPALGDDECEAHARFSADDLPVYGHEPAES